MAEVYRAYQPSLERFVAIKALHAFLADDPEFKSRFEKEARNIARLKHNHIVQVYDFEMDSDSETYYMVMELVEGPTLKDLMSDLVENGELLPVRESLRITREAAGALAYAHSQGMIHRDVKPANLMLDHGDRVVLTDFGIAKIVKGVQFTASGGMVGTPAYMAPEQGLGDAGDERSDLYSLGVILFQMTTGRLPYDGETPLSVILKHLNEPIPSARNYSPDLPEEVEAIINRLMAKEPDDRYQTAEELIFDLSHTEEGQPIGESRPMMTRPPRSNVSEEGDTRELKPIEDPPTNPITGARAQRKTAVTAPKRRFPWFLLFTLIAILIGGGLVLLGVQGAGPFSAFFATASPTPSPTLTESPSPTLTPSETPTETPSPTETFTPTATDTLTETPTLSPTLTPSETFTATDTPMPTDTPAPTDTPTLTFTPSETPTPTETYTPTETPTITLTPTLDITLTLLQSTLFFNFQTATVAACDYDYRIISQSPADGEYAVANTPYEREIILQNTGTCPWERNTSLVFVSGESLNATPPYFYIRQRVNVGEEVTILFRGRTPTRSGIASGEWELLTPGLIPIGEPLMISVNVFQSGG